jgi:hypothetical protein
MAREFGKIPTPVKRLRLFIDAVEYDRYERKGLSGVVTIAERLSEQKIAEFLTLMRSIDTQPGQDRDGQGSPRELTRELRWQIAKIDLARCQRVEPGEGFPRVHQRCRYGQPFVLMPYRFRLEPIVDLLLPAVEPPAWVIPLQSFEPVPVRKCDAVHRFPRIIAPSFF